MEGSRQAGPCVPSGLSPSSPGTSHLWRAHGAATGLPSQGRDGGQKATVVGGEDRWALPEVFGLKAQDLARCWRSVRRQRQACKLDKAGEQAAH